ncbi:uncharacterized protein LOC108732820 isoform X2 [Agrilus planipennis]|uniref:Uncharacterized protein LOC108732820 isoform X2 n=1 Tax=Agrilus planipennis TaxID=224129 RepID=A0A7F5R8T7_AGRPL|nr:uncharacterized protein LOC108732820 isoform X2 [Agrilus planipennis]
MLSPKQSTLTNNSNKNAVQELPFNPKAAEVFSVQKKYREKMIRYLSFCFPEIDGIELHETLKECLFQVDKAVNVLEKVSGITVTTDFVTWLKSMSFNVKEVKKLMRPPKSAVQNINEPENIFKLMTANHDVPENISREEQILNIIEDNQIIVENATLMQLLAKPVVHIERLPLSTIESTYQNLNKKLYLSSPPYKRNKSASSIKTTESPVKNKANVMSPKKRKTKFQDKIRPYKNRKTFADINEVNEEINSVLDSDILQSLSSEKIFKKIEDKLKSCDEIIVLPPTVISHEKTFNIGVKTFSLIDDHDLEESQSQDKEEKLSQSSDNIIESPPNKMQPVDTNDVHKPKVDEELSNGTIKTNKECEPFKEPSCSNDVVNNVDKIITPNSNRGETNLPTTVQETTSSVSTVNVNCIQEIGSTTAIEDNICGKENSFTTNQGILHLTDSVNLNCTTSQNEDNSCSDRILTTVLPQTLPSTDTVNLNHNQESASVSTIKNNNYTEKKSVVMSQENQQSSNAMPNCTKRDIGAIKNYNSGERHVPVTNPAMNVVSKTQPEATASTSSAKGNFLLNVTVEQATDTLLPLLKCLVSVTKRANSEIFNNSITMVSNSLKYYLSKVCIHSFNIYTFINIIASKMSLEDKSPDLDKKIVKLMFDSLSATTGKHVEESEFLLRFYTELREMANDPKYALDPLTLDNPIDNGSNAQEMDAINKNRFYDGHTYQPVDHVYLTNVAQVLKPAKSSVRSNYNSRKGSSHSNVKKRQNNRTPVSKSSVSNRTSNRSFATHLVSLAARKNNPFGVRFGSNQNLHDSAYISSTSSGDSHPSWTKKNLDPAIISPVGSNCSSLTSSIPASNYPMQTVSHQPIVLSTASSVSPLNSKPVYSVQSQISNANNVLTNFNKIPISACSSNLPYQKCSSRSTLQQPPPHYRSKGNSNLNGNQLIYLGVPPGSCSANSGTSSNSYVSQEQGTFLIRSFNHSNFNAPRVPNVSKIVLGCSTQKQLPSNYNTVTSNDNGIQNEGATPAPPTPHSTSNVLRLSSASNTASDCNTRKEFPSSYNTVALNNKGIQNGGTFSAPSSCNSTSNSLLLPSTFNTASGCNTRKELSSGYNTVTCNNSTQYGRTFSAPSTTSNALRMSSGSNTVLKLNTHYQLQQPPVDSAVTINNSSIHNQIRFNNNITSASSVSSLSNSGTGNRAIFASNEINVCSTPVCSKVPKVFPKSTQTKTVLSNIKESRISQDAVITGEEGFFPPSHQSTQQGRPRTSVSVNSDGGRCWEKGEDDSMASLKLYEMNMFPNMNENCPNTMEFIDLDYYYGNSTNK